MDQIVTMRDLRGFLTPKDIWRVINSGNNERDKMLLEVLWVTGARISEVVGVWGVRPRDLIPNESIIVMRTLKRKQRPLPERRVQIPKETMQRLVKFAETTGGDELIFDISRQWAFEIVRRAGREAGIERVGRKRIHPHHFRHSHCVAYARANNTLEGLRKLQQRLQHRSITTTAHYLQFAGERQQDIEKVFGKAE